MPTMNFYLEQDEMNYLEELANKWDIPKYKALRKIIREFKEDKGGEKDVQEETP